MCMNKVESGKNKAPGGPLELTIPLEGKQIIRPRPPYFGRKRESNQFRVIGIKDENAISS
jgi:hypothetical protein